MNILFLKKIIRIVRPQIEIGGLEITDAGIVFFSIAPETLRVTRHSVPLEAGIIQEGKIKQQEAFIKSLKLLHKQITSKEKKEIPVIVTISDENIFTQLFTLPQLSEGSFEEAVRLNMQTISPINFSEAYSGWEKIESTVHVPDVEIISSFVEKSIIDIFLRCLRKGGFSAVAIEHRSMSLARFIVQREPSFVKTKSYLLLHIGGDGITMAVITRGHLCFDKFSSWQTILKEIHATRDIIFSDFATLIIREIHQVTNFFVGRHHDPIAGVYIIGGAMEKQLLEVLKNKFSFGVFPLTVTNAPSDEAWFVGAGAALRGVIDRSEDTAISLTPEDTRSMLLQAQINTFIGAWRTMILISGTIILAAFIGIYIFLNHLVGTISDDLNTSITSASVTRYNELKQEATAFNDAVVRASTVQNQQVRWHAVLSDLYNQTGPLVAIDRIYVQSSDSGITLNARTNKEESAIEFKRKLEQLSSVTNVQLPLTSITQVDQNTIVFKITMNKK
ncbi:MAG: pilus assembly protein PilM [Candidatus Paceibacterota bacterium]